MLREHWPLAIPKELLKTTNEELELRRKCSGTNEEFLGKGGEMKVNIDPYLEKFAVDLIHELCPDYVDKISVRKLWDFMDKFEKEHGGKHL